MDATTNGHDRAEPAETDDDEAQGSTVFRTLGVIAVLCMAAFWIYVFANGDSIEHPDEFDDPAFVASAETICAKYQSAIAELPGATSATGPVERSVLVAQGTAELERMVAELAQLELPTDPKGASSFPQWLEDYDLYISDRETWTAQLAAGEDEAFLLSANAQGGRVTDLLTTYAEVNEMPSCAPSPDA